MLPYCFQCISFVDRHGLIFILWVFLPEVSVGGEGVSSGDLHFKLFNHSGDRTLEVLDAFYEGRIAEERSLNGDLNDIGGGAFLRVVRRGGCHGGGDSLLDRYR